MKPCTVRRDELLGGTEYEAVQIATQVLRGGTDPGGRQQIVRQERVAQMNAAVLMDEQNSHEVGRRGCQRCACATATRRPL